MHMQGGHGWPLSSGGSCTGSQGGMVFVSV